MKYNYLTLMSSRFLTFQKTAEQSGFAGLNRRFVLLLIFTFLGLVSGFSQTTYTWNNTSGGDWGVAVNWTPSRTSPAVTDILQFTDGNTYVVNGVPTQTIRQLFVNSGTNVSFQTGSVAILSINGPTATDNLVIASASTLQISSTGVNSLDIRIVTTPSQRANISGNLVINANGSNSNSLTTNTVGTTVFNVTGTGSIINNGATFTSTATTLVFGAGSTYVHATDAGQVPTAGWNTSSNCNITGIVNTNIASGLIGTFGNITWNCASQVAAQGYINGALTINGNLIVTAGTMSASSYVITGNAAGSVNIANGATFEIGNGAASTNTFPSVFVNANINMAVGSTVVYNSTSAQIVSGVPTYRSLIIRGTGVRTLGAATAINGDLSIEANSTFNTSTFQITGNATGTFSMAANSNMQIGNASAVYPTFPSNFLNANILLDASSTINYSTITGTQNVAGNIAGVGPGTYGNLTLTGGSGTKQLTGNTTVAGNFTISGAHTFNDGGAILTVNGNLSNAGTHLGTGSINLAGGSSSHLFTGTGPYTNLTLNDAWGANMTSNFTINGLLTLTNGNFNIIGQTLTLAGTFAATSGGLAGLITSNLSIIGTGAFGTLVFDPAAANLNALTINRTGPGTVNLGSDLYLNASSTGLTLTLGRLILGSSDLILSSTTTISGGSVNAMVVPESTGQLKKTFTTTLTFIYPVGDMSGSVEYSPVTLTSFTSDITRTIGVKLTNTAHPNDGGSAHRANRYWQFSDDQAGLGNYTYSASFSNVAADLVGTYANMSVGFWDGAAWSQIPNTIATPGMAIGANSQFTARLGGRAVMGRTAAAVGNTYTWLPTSGTHDFNDPTKWSPARNTAFTTDILQFTSGGTSTAINVPTQTVTRILVSGNTDVTWQSNAANTFSINGPTATTNLSVASGSTLQVSNNASSTTLLLNFTGVTGQTGNIAGTLRVNLNGTFTTTATNPVTFAAGGVYQHDINGGTIPTGAIWNATSTLNITGITTTTIANFTGTYGNVIWNCNPSQTATGALTGVTTIAGNLTISSGTFSMAANILNVAGNVLNNGTFGSTTGTLVMNGSSAQTISGSGSWIASVNNSLSGLTINNAAGVVLNTSFALQNSLTLTNGVVTGSGTLTLGIGNTSTLTTTITGGSLSPLLAMGYNLFNVTYNLNYNNSGSYNTSGELPPLAATAPFAGTMTIISGATVVMSDDGTVFSTSINSGVNAILRLNGKTLRLAGSFTNSALTINTMGLDASVANSKLLFIGNTLQTISLGNQTFASVITAPDVEISNTFNGNSGSGGQNFSATGTIKNLTVNTNSYFQVASVTMNVVGNIVNNGTIMANGSSTTALINMNGTVAQTISGAGTYLQYTTNPGSGVFPGLQIFNTSGATPSVSLNQNLALQSQLTLLQGSLGGSGTLTLGNAANAVTLTVTVGNGATAGGSIQNSMTVAYNLANMNYTANYNILSPSAGYTTGKELPSLASVMPIGGTVTILNTNAAGVTLGNDAKVFNWTINSNTTLNLNGKTVQVGGSFSNGSAIANTGLNASVAGSKIHFSGNIQQTVNLGGNQTFAGILTAPDIEISNSFYNGTTTCGATVTAASAANNLLVNAGGYFQINSINFNVLGDLTNNGLIFASGANTLASITLAGSALQTVSGTGNWAQIVTNPAAGTFPGIGINNTSGLTPAVNFNQNLILQNQLLLSAGNLGGTGALTLGNGVAGQTFLMNVGVSTSSTAGGSINAAKTVNYNLGNATFTGNYYNLSPAGGSTTGKELPNFAALPPNAGTVTVLNTNAAGVTLGADATVFNFTINSGASLYLNGKTLRLAGNFANSALAANTGLNSSVAGSKLLFVGNNQQTMTFGNQSFAGLISGPDIESSNNFYNANTTGSATFSGTGTVNNILVNAGAYLQNGSFLINVQGDITNNGVIYTSGTNTLSVFNFNGTSGAQTISGSGKWNQILGNGGNDMFPGFLINNSNGVVLNQDVEIQNRLDLLTAGGVLSGSGILTIGNGTPSTLAINRSFGSINMTNPVQYNLSGVTYNLIYGATAAASPITTGAELPPASITDYKLGALTNNNTIANGGVVLNANSAINTFSNASNCLFDLNDNTLNVYGTTFTNSGTLNASAANSRLGFIGISAQSLTNGTLTSGYISNVTVNNPAGFTFTNSTQIGSSSINGNLNLVLGTATISSGTTLTAFGTFSGSGTLISGSNNASLSLQGSAGSMGTINLYNGAQTFPNFTMNVTGASSNVIINGGLTISTAFTLTSGVVKMGANSVNYNATTTAPMLAANQNSSSYFEFNGASSGLAWVMSSVAAGTYTWPIGITGLAEWRPITMQTLATASSPASAKFGYVGTIAGAGYSANDIASADIRNNYIATLNTGGNLGTPNITMEYQNADFNTAPSAASAVNIWYYNIGASSSQWTSAGAQDANGTNGSNTTILKNGAINLTSAGYYPLNLAETNNDPGTSVNTFVWNGIGGTAWTNNTSWTPNVTAGNAPGQGANVGVDVIIPQVSNQPTATGLALSLNDITLGNGAVLTLATTTNMTVVGNFTNNNFNGVSNGLTWSGTPTVTYTGTSKLIAPGNYYNINFSGATSPILSPLGTINVANTFTPVNAGVTSTGSTVWFNGATQTGIPSFNFFNNVIFGNAGTTHTLAGQITIAGDLTINTTNFNDGAQQIVGPGLGSGTFTILAPSARTYNATYAGAKALPDFQTYNIWGNNTYITNFNFSGANAGVQTFPAATYGTMTLTNGGLNKKVAAGNMTVIGNFTLTSGSFDDGGFTVEMYRNLANNIAVGGSSSGITSTGTGKIVFTGAVAAHAISSTATPASYGNMELNDGTGATFTNSTALTTINGNLTVTNGTFSINSFTTSLTITGNTTIASGANLTFGSATGAKIFNNVTNNGIWYESSAPLITFNGDLENNGTYTATVGTHTFAGTAKEIRGTSFIAIPNVSITGTYTNKLTGSYTLLNGGPYFIATGGFRVTTNWVAGAGTLTQFNNALFINYPTSITPSIVASATGNTVVYTNGSATSIKAPTGGYYNVLLNPTSGVAYNLTGATAVNNNLTFFPSVASATFNDLTFLLTGAGSGTGTFDMSSPFVNTMNLTNTSATPTSPFPSFGTYNIGYFNTVNYNAAVAQDIVNSSVTNIVFGNLNIVGAGIKTARQNFTVQGNLTTNGGGLADNGNSITLNGDFLGTAAHTSTGSGKVLLSGGLQVHTLSRTGVIGNLELDDVQGANVTAAFTVNGNLGLKNGNFYLGAVITTLNGTISYPAPGGYLAGNLPLNSTSTLNLTGTGTLGDLRFAATNQNIGTLTMNRTATGLVNLGTDLTLNSTLTLTNGRVNLGNNNLFFGPSATSAVGTAANHIIADATLGSGRVYKYFPTSAATTFTYAIGDNTGTIEYTPLTITGFTPQGANRAIGVRVTDADHPQNLVGQPNRISRYWNFDDLGGASTGYNYTSMTLNYITGAPDNVGTLNTTNVQLNLYDNVGTAWLGSLNNTVTVNTTQAVATAPVYFNEVTSSFTNTDVTLRLNNPTTYTWLPTSGSADWNTASNWTPARTNPGVNDVLLFNQGGTSTATNLPTQTIGQFLVSGTTDITLQAATSNTLSINGSTATTNLSVASSSTLQISTATYGTLTLNYVTTTNQLASINGSMIVNNNGLYTPTNAVTTFGAGSLYNHNRDAGTVPAGAALVTWNTTSTCLISGSTVTNPTGLTTAMTYGNFTYDSPGVNGAFGAAMVINGNLTVSNGMFSLGASIHNLRGNLSNSAKINSGTSLLVMDGTSAQTISGAGQWTTAAGMVNGAFNGITINNAAGVILNSSFALQTALNLTLGNVTGTGTLTLGIGAPGTLTTIVTNGTLAPALAMGYNLNLVTYNLTYNNSTAPYTTSGELPSLAAIPPFAGTMTVNNNQTLTLGNDGTIFSYAMPSLANNILNLNGKTLRLAGNFTNSALAINTMGLNASAAGSKLLFIGSVYQTISFGNQTFGGIVTAPDMEVSNNFFNGTTSSGASVTGAGSVKSLSVNTGSHLQIAAVNLNVGEDITNNGQIFTSGASASIITMNGTVLQTIAGSGSWNQIVTNPGANRFTGFVMNNTSGLSPAVNLNQSFALQNTLTLTSGELKGSGTLTLGNGTSSTLTGLVTNGTIPLGGLTMAYNLVNATYNLTYNNSIAAYSTGGELPVIATVAPFLGTLTFANNSGVTLSNNVCFYNTTISSLVGNIFNLNGNTLRVTGNFTNSALGINTMGLNSSVVGSKLLFESANTQTFTTGNQTFGGVPFGPDVEVNNSNAVAGLTLSTTNAYINNLSINTSKYFQLTSNSNLFVSGDIANNGLFYISGASTTTNLVFNGTTAQTVAGTGLWSQITTNAGNGRFTNFTINNTSGLSPAVILNQNIALQNSLYLQNGELGGSGTLTYGQGVGTFLMTRTGGSMNSAFTPSFAGLTNTIFNVNYGNSLTPLTLTTGNEIPYAPTYTQTINNFVANFNATSGEITLGNNVSIGNTGVLSLTNTRFYLDAFDLTLNNIGAAITATGSINNMIVVDGAGQLKKSFAVGNTSAFIYPIGDNSGLVGNNTGLDYSPISLTITNNSAQRFIGVNLVDGQNPNDATVNNYISRYWNISDNLNGAGSYTYTGTFTYSILPTSDLVGTQNLAAANWWNGTDWNSVVSTYPANGFTITGQNQSTAPLGGTSPIAYTGRINPPQIYVWQPVTGTHDWNEPTKWLPNRFSPQVTDILKFTEGGTSTANNVPTQIISQFEVSNNTNISWVSSTGGVSTLSVNGPTLTDNIFIDNGSTLQLSSAGTSSINLTMVTTASQRANISGTFITNSNATNNNTLTANGVASNLFTVYPTGLIQNNGGTITSTAATLVFGNGATYNHNMDAGALPTALWYNAVGPVISNINVTGNVATAPTNQSQIFGNYTWDGTSLQTGAANLIMASPVIQGNFTVISTGSGSIVFNNGAAAAVNIDGDFILQDGTVNCNNSGASVTTINLAGNYNQTGGTFERGTGTGTTNALNFTNAASNKTFTQSAGIFNTTGIAVNVALNAIVTLNSDIVSNQALLNSGTLFMQDKIISGSGTFTLASAITATLGIGDVNGITTTGGTVGNVQVTGTKTYGTLANYIYNGTVAQVTGNALTTCNTLSIDNTAGVTQQNDASTTQNVLVTNQFTLTNGTYQIGGVSGNINSLTLSGPSIAGTPTNLASTQYSNLLFTGSQPGINIPSSILELNALTISNTNATGVTQNSNIDLYQSTAGVLALSASSRLFLGANNLTLQSNAYTATVSGTFSATCMVVADGAGQLRKNFGTSGFAAFVFPIGDNSGGLGNNPGFDYSPFTLTFTANSQDRIIGVNVTDMEHPSNAGVTDYASRYWSVTDSELGNGTYAYLPLSLTYSTVATSDVNGTTGLYRVNRYDGVAWSQFNSTVSAPTVSSNVSNTNITGTLGGNDFAIRFNPQATYNWVATTGSALWTDPNSWNPTRFSPQANDVLLFDQGGTSTATGVPTETNGQILFSNNTNTTFVPVGTNTLTLNGATLTNNLVVASGSTLTLESGLTFSYLTTASQRGSINGTLNVNTGSTFNTSSITTTIVTVNAGGLVNNNGGTFTTSLATFIFAAASDYAHTITSGTIPTASWNASSTVSILSAASGTLNGLAQTFGNFTLNTAAAVSTTLGTAITGVAGNLTLTSGELNAAGLTIAGNATGNFTMGASASYTTTRTATPWLPTLFVTANITLDPLSTVSYNGITTSFIIPTTQVNTYGKLVIGGTATKTLGGAITVRDVDVIGGTFADGAFQITGNAAGNFNLAAATTLQIGAGTATITAFPTNFVSANIVLDPTSTVIYTTTTNPQTVSAAPSAYGNLTVTGANVKNVAGNITVAGNLTIATVGETLDDNGNTITVNGNIANASSTPGHLGAGKIVLSGAAAVHTLTGTGSYTNLELNDINGATMGASFAVNGVLGLIIGNYEIGSNALTLNGPAINQTAGTMSSTVSSNLVFAPNVNANTGLFIPSSVSDLNALTINIAASNSVSLNGALNVNAASSALVLTSGKVNTTSSNLLTIVNTAVAALNGGSANSYVSGPLARNFPTGLSNISTYRFPIGKADYNQVELLNLSTSSLGTLTAEVFDANSGGTFGSGVVDINTNRYWNLNPSAAFISAINVRFTETVGGVGTANRVTQSNTLTGAYNSVGGVFVVGPPPTIASTTAAPGPVNTTLGYFVLGNTGMTYVSSTVIHPTLTTVLPGSTDQQLLRIAIVTGAGSPALTLNSLDLSTLGSTTSIDISSAKVYYTGTSATFATTTQFGSTAALPSGTFNVAGSQALVAGTNYFWLTYDVAALATLGNVVDAQCDQINLNIGTVIPTVTSPAGNRLINLNYCTPGSNSDGQCGDLNYTSASIGGVSINAAADNYFSYSGGTCAYSTYMNLSGNNYNGPFAPMIPGATYTFSVTKNGGSGQRVRMWIDWNNDGVLAAGEMIMNTTAASPSVVYTVPLTSPGGWHRMRVGMGNSYSIVDDACDVGLYNIGRYIDYRDFSITTAPPCTEPTVQATNIGFNTITASTVNVTFDRGNGTGGVMVVAHQAAAVNSDPNSGTTYTASTVFGSGSQIGTGNYVLYNSNVPATGSVSVPVTGLTVGQTYHFAVYEYNALSTCYNLVELTGNVLIIPPCSGTPALSTAIPSPASLCASGTSNLSLSGLAVTSGYTYQWYSSTTSNAGPWSPVGGATLATYTTPTITNTTWYYCDVTCSNGGASQNSTVAQVTVVQNTLLATIDGVAGPVNVCSGSTVNLAASGATTYAWTSTPIGFSSASATTIATPLVTTAYKVAGTISGCTFNTTVTASVFSVSVTPVTSTINTGSSVGLTATASNGTGTISYLWAPCSTLSSGTTASTTASPTGTTTYTVTAFDMNGCSATASATVNVTDSSIPSVVSGPIIVASGSGINDAIYTAQPIGFSFDFKGVSYTSLGISSNGFVWFGSTNPATNLYAPIASTTGMDGVISVLGANLAARVAGSTIKTQVSGLVGSRIFKIEWNNFKEVSAGSRGDYQILLFETSNNIELRYEHQPYFIGDDYQGQVGLRGSSNTDYNSREMNCSATSWTSTVSGNASSICAISGTFGPCWSGAYPPSGCTFKYTSTGGLSVSSGYTFSRTTNSWSAISAGCAVTTTVITPSGTTNLCPSGSVNLTATAGNSYQWYLNGIAIPGPTGTAQTLTGITTAGDYVARTVNACGSGLPSLVTTVTTNLNVNPSVSITSNPTPICAATTATYTAVALDAGCAAVYQWKLNGDQVGINSPTYTNTSLADGDEVMVTMQTNAYCSASNTANSNVIIKAPCFPVWVGGTVGFETDWNTATNWSTSVVPTLSDSAVIPVRPFLPFVSIGANAEAKYVTLETDGTLLIDAAKSLSIAVNGQFINNSGAINNLGVGKVIFNGDGTIKGTNATQFGDLELNAVTTLTTVPTLAGNLILNVGSSISTALNYTNTSTLVYNQSGTVNAANEWTGNSNVAGNGIPQNVIVQNASVLNMPSTSRGMAGNMNILNGSLTLNAVSGDLSIGGNWTRNATNGVFVANNRSVVFNGTAAQTIEVNTPTADEVFYKLEVNKTADILQIVSGTNLSIENELILTDGKFDLNNNQLTLGTSGNNGTLTGGGATNYIISENATSKLIRYTTTAGPTSYSFPLGDATGYTPIWVTLNSPLAIDGNSKLVASLTPSAHPNIVSSTIYLSRYWSVNPTDFIGATTYDVEYIYKDADVIGNESQLKPFKYGSTSGWIAALGSSATFEMGTGAVNTVTNTITWAGLGDFSDFTGIGDGTPLPISLLKFEAVKNNKKVDLTWTTLSEINNDFFTVERTLDGINYTEISKVDGAGNHNGVMNYQSFDYNPEPGINYYRLKQTDYNGQFEYSQLVLVVFNESSPRIIAVSPNPTTGANARVFINALNKNSKVEVTLFATNGALLITQKPTISDKFIELTLETNVLAPGVYYVRVDVDGELSTHKLVVTKN